MFIINPYIYTEVGGGTPTAAPIWESNGTIAANIASSTIDVPYPSTVVVNNILVMQVLRWSGNDTFTTPDGWEVMGYTTNATRSVTWFWKRATGSETGNETVTISDSGNNVAIMSRWSGCVTTGTPYEALVNQGIVNQNTIDIDSITTLGAYRRAVAMTSLFGLRNEGTPTDYVLEYEAAHVPASTIFWAHSQEIVSAGVVASDSMTLTGADDMNTLTFALIPTS